MECSSLTFHPRDPPSSCGFSQWIPLLCMPFLMTLSLPKVHGKLGAYKQSYPASADEFSVCKQLYTASVSS